MLTDEGYSYVEPPARNKGRVVVCGDYAVVRENGECGPMLRGCDSIGDSHYGGEVSGAEMDHVFKPLYAFR